MHHALHLHHIAKSYCIVHYVPMSQRTSVMQIRLSAEEKESFELASQISGVAVSGWARQALRRAAASELRSMGLKVPFAEAVKAKNG